MKEISNTSKKLYLLISIFIISLLLLFYINNLFDNFISNLDKQTNHQISKIKISKSMVENIFKFKASFYELSTSTSTKKARKVVMDKINILIFDLKKTIKVLEKGGTINHKVSLNIVGHLTLNNYINYNINSKDSISLEVISIKPRILQLENMLIVLNDLLQQQEIIIKNNNKKEIFIISKKIKRFYKSTPTLFDRMSEDIRRLEYESNLVLNIINTKIQEKKNQYNNLKLFFTLLIIFFVLVIGYWISSIINKDYLDLIKQKISLTTILNAQDSLIVVTNGDKMIKVNHALLSFFSSYKNSNEFISRHRCICDFFEENVPDDTYITNETYKDTHWIDYLLKSPKTNFKVIMKKNDSLSHFAISVQNAIINTNDSIYVITLNNITKHIDNEQELFLLNNNLEVKVKEKTIELRRINNSLEQKIKLAILNNTKQQERMYENVKMAQMGEMIGNIAHQWRQPLSVISTVSTGMMLLNDSNSLSNKKIKTSCNTLNENAQFLSNTIETFTNFIKEKKERKIILLQEDINKTLSIVSASLKNKFIKLKNNIKLSPPIKITMVSGELSQVIINIINNAKDILVENNIKEAWIEINIEELKEKVIITIEDNAGGIPNEIMPKIFDPYFTTKHKAQGTGLGLHMSYQIIHDSLLGKLSVKNTQNGAKFYIEIPR